jgi:hypothetical protein
MSFRDFLSLAVGAALIALAAAALYSPYAESVTAAAVR